jgi:hypothetical protein
LRNKNCKKEKKVESGKEKIFSIFHLYLSIFFRSPPQKLENISILYRLKYFSILEKRKDVQIN